MVNYTLATLMLRHVNVYAGGMDLAIGAAGWLPCKNGVDLAIGAAGSLPCKNGVDLAIGAAGSLPCKNGIDLAIGAAGSLPCKNGVERSNRICDCVGVGQTKMILYRYFEKLIVANRRIVTG